VSLGESRVSMPRGIVKKLVLEKEEEKTTAKNG